MRMKRLAVAVTVALVVSLMAGIVAYAASENVSTSVTVGQPLELTIDQTAISFGTAAAGSTDNPADNPVNATVTSQSFGFDVLLSGTDMNDGTNIIAVNNMEYTLTGGATGSGTVPGSATIVAGNQPVTGPDGTVYTFDFTLDVPAGTPASDYTGSLTIEATTI